MTHLAPASSDPRWRVLHVMDSGNLGGIQRFLSCMVPTWTDRRFEHKVAALHGPGVMHKLLVDAGLDPVYFAGSKHSPLIPLRLLREVRRWRPHLIHAHGFVSCYVVEQMRPLFGSIPCISHLHVTYHPEDPFRWSRFYYHKSYRKAQFLLACSRGALNTLPTRPPGGARVIYYGLDATRFHPAPNDSGRRELREKIGLGDGDCVVGTTGRLVNQKGISVLVRAMALLRGRDVPVRALVVGSGPEGERLRVLARELGVIDRIVWAGYQDDVAPWLHAMDIFAFPTFTEGLGLSLIEAMACGLPCVISDFPVGPEIVRDGEHALVFPRGDDGALADGIARLVADPDQSARLGTNARAHVVEQFSLEAMNANLANAYESILETGQLGTGEDTP